MPTIHESAAPYTLVIEFEVAPDQQHPLIEGIADVVQHRFRPDPRFLSASFHASLDGRRMLNYAQWTSQADYDAFMGSAANEANDEANGAVIARCGARRLGIHAYTVHRVVERPPAAT